MSARSKISGIDPPGSLSFSSCSSDEVKTIYPEEQQPLYLQLSDSRSSQSSSYQWVRVCKPKKAPGWYWGSFNKLGERHGKGIMVWDDKSEYEGDWVNGKKEGFGIYRWSDGCVYRGGFRNGGREGPGMFIKQEGIVEVSYYHEDRRVGQRIRWSSCRTLAVLSFGGKDNERLSPQQAAEKALSLNLPVPSLNARKLNVPARRGAYLANEFTCSRTTKQQI